MKREAMATMLCVALETLLDAIRGTRARVRAEMLLDHDITEAEQMASEAIKLYREGSER